MMNFMNHSWMQQKLYIYTNELPYFLLSSTLFFFIHRLLLAQMVSSQTIAAFLNSSYGMLCSLPHILVIVQQINVYCHCIAHILDTCITYQKFSNNLFWWKWFFFSPLWNDRSFYRKVWGRFFWKNFLENLFCFKNATHYVQSVSLIVMSPCTGTHDMR